MYKVKSGAIVTPLNTAKGSSGVSTSISRQPSTSSSYFSRPRYRSVDREKSSWFPGTQITLAKRVRRLWSTRSTKSVRSATSPATINQSEGFVGCISSMRPLFALTAACRSETAHNVVCDDFPAMVYPSLKKILTPETLAAGTLSELSFLSRKSLAHYCPTHRIKAENNSDCTQKDKRSKACPNTCESEI